MLRHVVPPRRLGILGALVLGACVLGGRAEGEEFSIHHGIPTPTASPRPSHQAIADPLLSLSWLIGRWRLTGRAAGGEVASEASFAYGYEGRVIFVHTVLRRGKEGLTESHGAICAERSGEGFVLATSTYDGTLRTWKAPRTAEMLLTFDSLAPENDARGAHLRWTLRRNPDDALASYLEEVAQERTVSRETLTGRLTR